MGDRDRYNERGEGRHDRDQSQYRDQRGGREWESQDDYYRSAGRDRSGGYSNPQDYRNYGNYGRGYRGGDPWSGTRSFEDQRRFENDWGSRRYEPSGRSSFGSESQRERNDPSSHYDPYERSYGAGSRGSGRELGDYNRNQNREPYGLYYYESYSDYGGGGYEGDRGRSQGEESFGQQMRDMGHRVMSKVKRAFRGPKGYKRSDERIREDVNDRLSEQASFDPSEIEVSVSNGEVTLTGSVDSRRNKFMAEEIADDVGGVTEVHNQIRVTRAQSSLGGTPSTDTAATASGSASTAGADPSRTRNARAQ